MKSRRIPASATMHTFVGNLGCIRFPQPIRKAAGIKRGDRLTVTVQGPHGVLLEKLSDALPSDAVQVELEACACMAAPGGCSGGVMDLVTVGWSYVQLNETLATELGFLPGTPLKLLADPGQISASLHEHPADLADAAMVKCPP